MSQCIVRDLFLPPYRLDGSRKNLELLLLHHTGGLPPSCWAKIRAVDSLQQDPMCGDSERTLRPSVGTGFVSLRLFSPRPGWLVALALSTFWHRELFHSDVQVNHFLLTTPYPCVTCTYPILSSLLSSTPPRREYILNGTWRSHRNLPCGLSLQVYTQYPRPEVFTMTSSFSCMRSPL